MPNTYLIVLPLLSFVITGVVCLMYTGRVKVQRVLYMVGSGFAFGCGVKLIMEVNTFGILHLQVGGWEAPFGITVIVDRLAAIMVAITTLLGFVTSFYAFSGRTISRTKKRVGFYVSLSFMLAGITGSFITGDLFNLYVWFEVMLISSFVLITLGSEKDQLEGGLKYVVINFVASSFLLLAIGVLYGTTGNINMAALAENLKDPELSAVTQIASVFLLISFGAKAALFPLFFWLPTSYHTPPIAIVSIIAGLLTKVGVYTLMRTYTLLFPLQNNYIQMILMVLACITMVIGVIGAIAQKDVRKVLSFNLISKIGFLVLGLAIYTPLAIAGTIFYMLHHILVKTNLFFVTGLVREISGSYDAKEIKGLYDAAPMLSFIFIVLCLTLVGIPPFSGFWGKFMLADAGLKAHYYFPVGILLFTSLLTLYSVMKVWQESFLAKLPVGSEQLPEEGVFIRQHKLMYLAVAFLLGCTLYVSFYPQPLMDYAYKAAEQLLDPSQYIHAVLGKN